MLQLGNQITTLEDNHSGNKTDDGYTDIDGDRCPVKRGAVHNFIGLVVVEKRYIA